MAGRPRCVRDEVVAAVARDAGLAPEQAAAVVAVMLRHLGARLASPLVGQISAVLAAPSDAG